MTSDEQLKLLNQFSELDIFYVTDSEGDTVCEWSYGCQCSDELVETGFPSPIEAFIHFVKTQMTVSTPLI
jgi:hypothetical protein